MIFLSVLFFKIRISPIKARKADAIVVLSGGGISLRGDDQILEWDDPDRFLSGVDLFKSKKSQLLIFTNAPIGKGKYTGEIFKIEANKLGVPSLNIITTSIVYNTIDESFAVKRLFDDQLITTEKNILLVTSAFHMKRAVKLFESRSFNVIPYPVDFKSSENKNFNFRSFYQYIPNSRNLNKTTISLRELIGRLYSQSW